MNKLRPHKHWLTRRVAEAIALCLISTTSAIAQDRGGPFAQPVRTFLTAAEFARITEGRIRLVRSASLALADGSILTGSQDGIVSQRVGEPPHPYLGGLRLPNLDITVLVEEQPAVIWAGTSRGLFALNRFTRTVDCYYAGQRWLPEDHVTGIGVDSSGKGRVIWVETPKGFSRIEYNVMTLAEKSKAFVERIRARHVRWGLTADSQLRVPGDLSTNQMVSTDNDGLWTAIYVAAECFRYKVTGEADARENARDGMRAIVRLEEITGVPGFPARSFIRKGVDMQPQDGEWHDTPDGKWRWKGDTSSDEIVGHYFVYPIYYDLVANEDEKRLLASVLDRITNHILDNNYQLIDLDGRRTRWGWWGPEAIWQDPDETGLRALHILAHLRSAMHVTQSEAYRAKYKNHYDDLITRHRYHLLTRNQKINIPGHVNHSDDELAFLSYYPLVQYETDPELRKVYVQSLERAWQIERSERNPLWNFIYAAGSGSKDFDRAESIRTLREIPMDQIKWTVINSSRLDVMIDMLADRQGRKQALIVLPYDQLPMSKWNGNPYALDGGDGGRSEDDGAYFLLPYWLGRYHRLIM
jgi:hypothetical protein